MFGYDRIVSLGSFCHLASHLKKREARTCSYPFDWALTSPAVIADCLRDDFARFLDPAEHEACAQHTSNHRTYGQQVTGLNFQGAKSIGHTFTHKDITTPEGLAYYTRCVERFRAMLAMPGSTLFVFCATDEDYEPNEIEEVQSLLASRCAGAFDIVCLTLRNDYSARYTLRQKNGIVYGTTWTYSRSDGRGYAADNDNHYFHGVLGEAVKLIKNMRA